MYLDKYINMQLERERKNIDKFRLFKTEQAVSV